MSNVNEKNSQFSQNTVHYMPKTSFNNNERYQRQGGLAGVSTLTNLLDGGSSMAFPVSSRHEPEPLSTERFLGKARFDLILQDASEPRPVSSMRYVGSRLTSQDNATTCVEHKSTTEAPAKSFYLPARQEGLSSNQGPTVVHNKLNQSNEVNGMVESKVTMESKGTVELKGMVESTTSEADQKPMDQQTSLQLPTQVIWKPRHAVNPSEKLRRTVNSLLNKLTVENFPVVAEKLCICVESIDSETDLSSVISLVLDKACTEPVFSEMYADLVLILSFRAPTLPVEDSSTAGKPLHQAFFSLILYTKWKEEFQRLRDLLETYDTDNKMKDEEQNSMYAKAKIRIRGLCCCFAEFVIRRILGMRGFSTVVSSMLSLDHPPEYLMEGVCQMLLTAGNFFDNDSRGKVLLDNCFGRLQELQLNNKLSKRIQCLAQDLFDARKIKWHKKVHTEKAKGLAQIQQEVEDASLVGGSTVIAQYGTVIKLGERSNLIHNREYAAYIEGQEELHIQRIKKLENNKF